MLGGGIRRQRYWRSWTWRSVPPHDHPYSDDQDAGRWRPWSVCHRIRPDGRRRWGEHRCRRSVCLTMPIRTSRHSLRPSRRAAVARGAAERRGFRLAQASRQRRAIAVQQLLDGWDLHKRELPIREVLWHIEAGCERFLLHRLGRRLQQRGPTQPSCSVSRPSEPSSAACYRRGAWASRKYSTTA